MLFALVTGFAPGFAYASRLDAVACQNLEIYKKSLVKLGVKKNMARGAVWAKSNLGEGELIRVKHFVIIQDMLKFRCPSLRIARSEEHTSELQSH